MPDFDFQWKNLSSKAIEYNRDRIDEFLQFTGFIQPTLPSTKTPDLEGKLCLDAGCGNGRYTFAMLALGAARVDSIDISSEAIARCSTINPHAEVKNIFDLPPNPIYDFVLCWGVLNHVENPRDGFKRLATQVKRGGTLHIMVYHKDVQGQYEEGRKKWPKMSHQNRVKYCNRMIKKYGGELHGWWDALNPTYNWSWQERQIMDWFTQEGFSNLKLVTKYNINLNGTLL